MQLNKGLVRKIYLQVIHNGINRLLLIKTLETVQVKIERATHVLQDEFSILRKR